jgi:hypothetical protein
MPLIRNCSSCGGSNRIPAKHLSDVGKCGACKAELPAIGDIAPGPYREIKSNFDRRMERLQRKCRRPLLDVLEMQAQA